MRRFRMNSRGRGPTRPAFDVRVLEVGFRPVHKCLPRPNGSRLSCGRNARGRKAAERQTKRLASEAIQLFPTCERPPASSAC